MKKISIILLAAAFVMGFASCSDQLNIEKHGNMGTIEDFYKTDADAEAAAASMYIQWRNIVTDELELKLFLSDDFWAGGGSRGDVGNFEALDEFTHGTENPYVQSLYENYYKLIYEANLILTYLDENGSDVMKRNRAEALVARGYAHLMLGIYFGKAPVVTQLLTGDNVRPSASAEGGSELFAQAEADLKAAINSKALIEKFAVDDKESNNRITLGAAKSLLGKVYVFENKMSEAAAVLDEVINSGKYELLPTDEYDNMHHAINNNGKENILEFQKRKNNDLVWVEYIGNTFELLCGWRSDKMIYTDGSPAQGDRGGTASYGFANPTKELAQEFKDAGEWDTPRRLCTLIDRDEMMAYGITFEDGYALYGVEGYFFWKRRMIREDAIDPYGMAGYQVTQYNNMHVMRYAEVLLLAAEAHNGDAKSLEYLNMVHQRGTGTTLAAYSLDALKREKRLELAGEGCRFEDLVRWGDAATKLATRGQKTPQFFFVENRVDYNPAWDKPQAGFKAGKHEHLPIPSVELDINPNMSQNPGW